jgi:DNA-binding transcriptional LysR family regulator
MWEAIELRELRVFLVLAEELHFGRTAQRLRVTPSRVSQSLRGLERKLGGQLVYRTNRHVELTALGERFRQQVGAAHQQLAGVLQATHDHNRGLEGTLRLGLFTPASEGPHLLAITSAFQRRHPECRVEVARTPYSDPFGCLRRGEIDLLVSWLPHGQPDLVTGPILTRAPRVLGVAHDHPLARCPTVSLEEIADYRVAPIEDVFPKDMAEAWTPRNTPSGRPIPRLQIPSGPFGQMARDDASQFRHQMSWWIRTGQIVLPTVAPYMALLGPDIIYVPIPDMPPLRAGLVWPRRARDPRRRAFIDLARDILRSASQSKADRLPASRRVVDPVGPSVDTRETESGRSATLRNNL